MLIRLDIKKIPYNIRVFDFSSTGVVFLKMDYYKRRITFANAMEPRFSKASITWDRSFSDRFWLIKALRLYKRAYFRLIRYLKRLRDMHGGLLLKQAILLYDARLILTAEQ